MGMVFSRPLSPEEIKARAQKAAAEYEKQRETDRELLLAYLLEKVLELEDDEK